MRFDEGELASRQLFLDDDRLVSGPLAKAPQAVDQIVIIEVEPVGDRLQVLFFEILAGQNQAEAGVVVDDDAAVAVENLAARRENRKAI